MMTANDEKLPPGEYMLVEEFVHMTVSCSDNVLRKESF